MDWVDVNSALPNSDDEVWVRTDCGKVFLAYCDLERVYKEGSFDFDWKREWLCPIDSREVEEIYDITHWCDAVIPEFKECDDDN